MALPEVYRPSRKKRRNKTEREGPFPIQPKKKSHDKYKPNTKTNSKGKQEEGGRCKNCPTSDESLPDETNVAMVKRQSYAER